MIEVDIPQLSTGGIQFNGSHCFDYVYSLQSSSTLSLVLSLLDAPGLEQYISFGSHIPSSSSHVVRDPTKLSSIPLNVTDLWIGRLDTSGVLCFSFDFFQSLQSLVIDSNLFWRVTCFELSSLPQLQSVKLGHYSFCFCHSVVFKSDGMDGVIIQICPNCSPFNLVVVLFMVMIVKLER